MTITSANSGQTYLIDVFATVVGASGNTNLANLGINNMLFRGYSSSVNKGAFTTSGTGSVGVQNDGNLQSTSNNNIASTPTSISDGGSTNGTTVSATADGVVDLPGTSTLGSDNWVVTYTGSGTKYVVGGQAASVYGTTAPTIATVNNPTLAGTPNAFQTIGSNGQAVANSFTFLLGQFDYTTGTVKAAGSSALTTSFTPTVSSAQGSNVTGNYTVSTSGSVGSGDQKTGVATKTTGASEYSTGSSVSFVVAGTGGGGNNSALTVSNTSTLSSVRVMQNSTTEPGSLALTNIQTSGTSTTYTLADNGDSSPNVVSLSSTSGTINGSASPGTTATAASVGWASTSTLGARTGSILITNTGNGNATTTAAVTGAVVANRILTASTNSAPAARTLLGQTAAFTVFGNTDANSGNNNDNTMPSLLTVSGAASGSSDGVTISTTGGQFSGTGSFSGTIAYGGTGNVTSANLNTGSGANGTFFTKEGLTGESLNSGNAVTLNYATDVVQNRTIMATLNSSLAGRILLNSTAPATITGAGSDTTNTKPTLNTITSQASGNSDGVTFSTTTTGQFSSAGTTAYAGALKFTQTGNVASASMNLNSGSNFTKEGLTGESINGGSPITLSYGPTDVVQARTFTIPTVVLTDTAGTLTGTVTINTSGADNTTTEVNLNTGASTALSSSATTGSSLSFTGTNNTKQLFNSASSTASFTVSAPVSGTSGSGTITLPGIAFNATSTGVSMQSNESAAFADPTNYTISIPYTFNTSSSNTSVLNLTPATAPATGPFPRTVLAGSATTTNLTLANTNSASQATFTGTLSTPSAGTATATGFTGSGLTLAASGSETVPVVYNAPSTSTMLQGVTFTYNVANTSNTNDVQGTGANKTTTLTFSVAGTAGADNTNSPSSFTGTASTATVAHTATYAGLTSEVTSVQSTGAGSDAFGTPGGGASPGTGQVTLDSQFGGGTLQETASILAGVNSTANGGTNPTTVSMAWRTRITGGTNFEVGKGGATAPTSATTGLISDVVNLTGLTAGAEQSGSVNGTDPFVMQMVYNPNLLPKASHGANNEQGSINNSLLYLVSLSPTTSQWVRATSENGQGNSTNPAGIGNVPNSSNSTGFNGGNTGVAPGSEFSGSFAAFVAANSSIFGQGTVAANVNLANITAAQLDEVMGAYGADPTAHDAWAVVDHNSEFAVVPEPATLLLAGLGVLGLAALRRRKT